MNKAIRNRACIVLAMFIASVAAKAPEFTPVQDLHPSHLGITVEAPGSEGWLVAEERYKAGWRLLYRHAAKDDPSRTSGVFLKSDQYKTGRFARDNGSLEQLAHTVLKETRTPDNNQYTEKWAEVARADVHGVEAWRMRIAWEERRNPNYPDAVLLMEVVQVLMLHPQDPDKIISIAATTRRRLEQEPLSGDELAASFVGSMRFE